MKFPFLFSTLFIFTYGFSQDTLKSFKTYNSCSSAILNTDPYYPLTGSPVCTPGCHSMPCITKAKRDSLQANLNEMNAGAESREFFYYMEVNECNCQVKIIKNYKWPKGSGFEGSNNTLSGEQYRRSPLRSSSPAEAANSLFIGFQ